MNRVRRASRHTSSMTANLHASRGAAGTIVRVMDISTHGCQLEYAKGSKIGKNCELYFDWRGSMVGVEAKIVWTDTRGRAGLRYEKIDDHSRRCLQELCSTLQTQSLAGRRAADANRVKPAPEATQSFTPQYLDAEHPLFPTKGAAPGSEADSERSRRTLPRYISELRGDVKDSASGNVSHVSLVDLSVSGARLEGAVLPEAGQACQLHTEWDGREITLDGEVAWKTKKQVGIRFSALDDATLRKLRIICGGLHLAPSGPPV